MAENRKIGTKAAPFVRTDVKGMLQEIQTAQKNN
jgi:hypothetical protein